MSDAPALPPVTRPDVLDDQQWFAEQPSRQYRLRPGWAIRRRRGNVFLRSPMSGPVYDTEAACERVWWLAAWPDLDPKIRDELAKAARRNTTAPRASSAPARPAAPESDASPDIPIVKNRGQ